MTTTTPSTPIVSAPTLVRPTQEELAGRLAAHLVAAALVRKSVDDPVPFPVWWHVTDALRASVLGTPADALPEVDAAITVLLENMGAPLTPRDLSVRVRHDDDGRELRLAQLLVARLVFAAVPTPPTLLHVRLARLRRALSATAAGGNGIAAGGSSQA
jgi:hypothetical protein